MENNQRISDAHQTIIDIRTIRDQLNHYMGLWKGREDMKDLVEKAKEINKSMTEIEEELYQTKNRSRQDPLNFPIRLTNKLSGVVSITNRGNFPPTKGSKTVAKELGGKIDTQLQKFETIQSQDLPEFNQMVREKSVDAIVLDKTEKKSS